jgi:hypothetical protein
MGKRRLTERVFMISGLPMASGIPPPKALAITRRSGTTFQCSSANTFPVRLAGHHFIEDRPCRLHCCRSLGKKTPGNYATFL